MPKYRVETNERRWVRCIYEIVCDDVKDAILCVEEDGIEPRTIESGPDNSDSDEVQFQDVRRFADDGDALATAPSQPKPNDELVADIEASAPSSLNFGVEPSEFPAGIVNLELPVDASLLRVRFLRPSANFSSQEFQVADAAAA